MSISGLLGPLEQEIMEVMWGIEEGTVRHVVDVLQKRRSIAYTTVMTIMNNLVAKGLLTRNIEGRAYIYAAALNRDQLREKASREAVTQVLARFGDLAIARFVEAAAQFSPEHLEQLKKLGGLKEGTQTEETSA
jgi:predicted transcriptional regulator